MKRALSFLAAVALLGVFSPSAWAYTYSGSVVAPSGQTLYYIYRGNFIVITCPSVQGWGNYTKPTGTLVIPDSITYNGATYPVTSIGGDAFKDCSGLTSVTIPNSVTSISYMAFFGCNSLTSVTIPSSVTSIGFQAFRDCNSLTSIAVASGNTVYDSRNNCNAIILTDSNTLIQGCNNTVIPSSITSIGEYAFQNCTGLTSVTIPDGVTSIDWYAFSGCSGLTSVTIPDNVTSIGSWAFSYCSGLTSVTIGGSVTAIYTSAFEGCSGLTSVTIPGSVTTIGERAFQSCSGLTSVTIPSSITSIGGYAFQNCSGLTSVIFNADSCISNNSVFAGCSNITNITFGNNVKRIPSYLCNGRSGLTSVTIPSSVTTIGDQAFRGCSGLTSVTIPDNVTSIGENAFLNCTSLDTVYMMPPTPPSLGNSFVFSLNASGRVFITTGCSINNYFYSSEWSSYIYDLRSPIIDINVNVQSSDLTHGTADVVLGLGYSTVRCDSTVVVQATANYGYHFTAWNDGNTDNPRTITLTQDTAFSALFERNSYIITVLSDNTVMGSAAGGDTALYLDSVTVSATPNHGYHFAAWNDGNTDNPRTVTVTCDSVFTALFAKNSYMVSVSSADSVMGVAEGPSVQSEYLDSVTLTATPNYGYHFTQWSDGNTDNPRTFTLTQDTAFMALFDRNDYMLTLNVNDSTLGSVTGGGSYLYLDTATVTASCTVEHHHFVMWSDGSTEATRSIVITQDSLITALFAIDTHTVMLLANDSLWGTVSGAGEYPYGTAVTIEATATDGYHFAEWSNGSRENPQAVTLEGDTVVTATFTPDVVPEIYMVTVQNGRNVVIWNKGLEVTAYNIYREGSTSDVYDLVATIPYDSVSLWTDTASRPRNRSYRYRMTATDLYGYESEPGGIHKTMHLTISQGVGNEWNLVWTPYEGADYSTYVIYRGTDAGNIQQIDVMPSNGNTTYTDDGAPAGTVYYQVGILLSNPATKSGDIILSNIATNGSDEPTGIEEVGSQRSEVRVYVENGRIHVTSAGQAADEFRVYDVVGREVYRATRATETPALPGGVYLVKVGTLPARRVVVIR